MREDVEPVVEIFAQPALLHRLGRVDVGRGDHAHVDRLSCWPPSRRNRAFLQHAQQLHLEPSGISPISSRNSVPPLAQLEAARPALDGARERAALVAEELAFESVSGIAAQLIATNGCALRGLELVDRRATSSLPVPDSP